MPTPKFIHLSVHTEFSLSDSTIGVKKLIKTTKSLGMPAVAVNDNNNLISSIKLYQAAFGTGVKPIISSELTVIADGEIGKMTLIAKNDTGYRHLKELVSDSYEKGIIATGDTPAIEIDWMIEKSDGLIVLSGGRKGILGKLIINKKIAEATKFAESMRKVFGTNFYIEVQRIGHPMDDRHNTSAISIASKLGIPIVATNPAVFLEYDDYTTHEVRVAIAAGETVVSMRNADPFLYTREQYLKSPDEMAELFSDIPSAIENTVEIAKKCSVDITLNKSFLPAFPVPDAKSEADYLKDLSKIGLVERLESILDKNSNDYNEQKKVYEDRLDFELNVINNMGFPGYFLIVADFIQWGKNNGIPVGPGRGSGAGSLVAYSLKITDLDPLKYDLLFERFLNPERVSMPDFDIDFCMDRREEVIRYVSGKYGENAVSQIITIGTMAAKMVVRDVARALGFPYAVGNKISNMISGKPGTMLQDAIDESSELKFTIETDSQVKTVIDHSLKLEGMARQHGKHAGGVIIAPGNLTDFTATLNEIDRTGRVVNKVSQLDKNDVETAGLVKFDFLGLKTLTIIQNAVDNVNVRMKKEGKPTVDISTISLDEPDVYKMFQAGQTTAVFQVESKGMKDLLKRLKPDRFEDLIALVALYRPGPLESGMVDNFINRKHGREELAFPDATYQHESLRGILTPTYGVILYQEQVMQIAQILAGYTLGGADMLRRAMGKKKPEEMEKQRSIFEKGAIDNNVDGGLAMKIFDLVEKFAGYGFNKSHSAAYALIAYQTAWLKTKYPAEFMAAVLSGDMDRTDKIVTYVNECRAMGLNLKSPNINESNREFVAKGSDIIYGLGAVKNVGETAIKTILDERMKGGKYKSLHDFCSRCSVNKTTLEASIFAGALDVLNENRASTMATYPKAMSIGKQIAKKENASSQMGLFGSIIEDESIIKFEPVAEWSDLYRLSGERKTLGLYLTGHPIESYEDEVRPVITGKLVDSIGTNMEDGNDDIEASEDTKSVKWEDKHVTIAGLIINVDIRNNANGSQTAYLVIDDKSRQIDVMVYSKSLHECQHILQQDTTVIIEGKIKQDRKSKKLRLFANSVISMDMLREQKAKNIQLNITKDNFTPDLQKKLQNIIEKQPEGYAKITAFYGPANREVAMGSFNVKITDDLLEKLRQTIGRENVTVVYHTKGGNDMSGKSIKQATEQEKARLIEEGQTTRDMRHRLMAKELEFARMSFGM